jgi:hypothetical protein
VIAAVTAVLVQWRLAGTAEASAPIWDISGEKLPNAPRALPPWGELQKIPMITEKPEEFIDANSPAEEATAWTFSGESETSVHRRLEEIGLPPAVIAALFDPAACGQRGSAFVLKPADAFILNLTPEHRRVLYKELRRHEAAHFLTYPFTFPAGKLPAVLASRVRPETMAVVEKLLYRIGRADCFSDVGPAFRAITGHDERRRTLKALTRQDTLLIKAVIRADTNVDRLIGYWSTPNRRKDLQPLLESLTRVPGGVLLDVSHLLPGFARQRLYTYPEKVTTGQRDCDCHWTCLNFFRTEPDMTYLDSSTVAVALKRDYELVPAPARLGDVILYTTDGENVVHSCVYIADDVVFTKNGANPMQPWTFMTLPEMEIVYPADEPYRMLTYRMKGM